jgi:hypothetical protein
MDRIRSKVVIADNGCWLWTGAVQSRGYGSIGLHGRSLLVHRLAYEQAHGPVPFGMQVDHLCRVKRCCNPAHLEAVTPKVNLARAAAAVTHCPQGHAYDAANTYVKAGSRQCRACRNDYSRKRRALLRAAS